MIFCPDDPDDDAYSGRQIPFLPARSGSGDAVHRLTQEQQAVVDHDLKPGQSLKIMAFAGTGKTTTLEAYTRQRPHLKFLYIAFNKSVQTEAERRFPANVTARTTHALAFRARGFKDYESLRSYARTVEDFELLSRCRIVDKYKSRIPALVDRVLDQASGQATGRASGQVADRVTEAAGDGQGRGILLTTAHKAKGLEWAQVLLTDDFAALVKDGVPADPSGTDPDEFNLVYVAMTHLRFTRTSDIPKFVRYCLKNRGPKTGN